MNKIAENLNTVNHYLARRDIERWDAEYIDADILVLLSNGLLESVHLAAGALKNGFVEEILVSGGQGHSTTYLQEAIKAHPRYHTIETTDRSEAAMTADILTQYHGVPLERIMQDDTSTNCGENAERCFEVLNMYGKASHSLILMQDPTMQQRSQACFNRVWREEETNAHIDSFAPFIPVVEARGNDLVITGSTEPVWSFDRLLSLSLGEIPRLRDEGYGPLGKDYFDHVEIPEGVLAAHAALTAEFPQYVRLAAE
jgi:uncharacterized SAM-binding protein YcdF (DUF218 family)